MHFGLTEVNNGAVPQACFVLVLGCSDASVSIELTFQQDANDIFVTGSPATFGASRDRD